MKWIKNNAVTLLFTSIIVGIVVSFIVEYMVGNCRIGLDMGYYGLLWVLRIESIKTRINIELM